MIIRNGFINPFKENKFFRRGANKNMGWTMEPIVQSINGHLSIIGLEILARPIHEPIENWISFYDELSSPSFTRFMMVTLNTIESMRHYEQKTKVFISINMSSDQAQNSSIIASFSKIAAQLKDRLVIEWVEDHGKTHEASATVMNNLRREFGVQLAVDDMGTGVDGMQRSLLLDPEWIKVDGALFQKSMHDHHAKCALDAILYFSKSIGCSIIIEWIESEAQLLSATETECHGMQGFLFQRESFSQLQVMA
jgi:EAL domain-containing protein (putative c-di-GMP-specific phosphodiesterase class I)